ncbi:MAG: hypothetical protein K6T86_17430 [Pirellulales bacterium]|nr:hypothetical protein [Pirellulales bacterium]
MASSLVLSLGEGAVLAEQGQQVVCIRSQSAQITLRNLTPGVRHAWRCLAHGGEAEDALAEGIEQRDGTSGLSRWHYYLQQLRRRGLIWWMALCNGRPLATRIPTSPSFIYPDRRTRPHQAYVLSRFAYLHTADGQMLLESPLAHAHIRLHDVRTAALVHSLAPPARTSELAASGPGLSAGDIAMFLDVLLNANMIGEADEAGVSATDRSAALQSWEFHDLLFHARSRLGGHANPAGAAFRFAGQHAPPPALKPQSAAEAVDLERPDPAQLRQQDPPFAEVQQGRRSVREYGARPITAPQLGEFL